VVSRPSELEAWGSYGLVLDSKTRLPSGRFTPRRHLPSTAIARRLDLTGSARGLGNQTTDLALCGSLAEGLRAGCVRRENSDGVGRARAGVLLQVSGKRSICDLGRY
jgi:hypothetical protein